MIEWMNQPNKWMNEWTSFNEWMNQWKTINLLIYHLAVFYLHDNKLTIKQ